MTVATEEKVQDDRTIALRNLSDEQVVVRVTTDHIKAKGDKAKDFLRNEEYRRMYMALDPSGDVIDETTGQIDKDERVYSNTYLPIGASMVDAATAQLYNIIFSSDDYMEIIADNWEDEILARKITAHLKKRHEEMKFRYRVYESLQQALCFDYCITFARWEIRPGFVRKLKRDKGFKQIGGVQLPYQDARVEPEWVVDAVDRSDIEIINFFNCAHDKGAKHGLDDSELFIDWRFEPIERLKMREKTEDRPWGKYTNVDAAIKQASEIGSQKNKTTDPADRGSGNLVQRLEIIRYWTHDQVVEVAGGEVLSRVDLDGWPLQEWKIFSVPGEFRGMGLLERIERGQLDVNAILNNARNAQNLGIDPWVVVSEDLMGAEEGDIDLYPGKVLVSSAGQSVRDQIYVHQPSTTAQGAPQELEIQVDAMEGVVGLGENQQGQLASGRRSAREVGIVQNASVGRAAQVAQNLETNALNPFYMEQFKLEQQNLTVEQTFKYMGPEGTDWMTITPEDYRWFAQPRFQAKGSSRLNRDLELQYLFKGTELAMMAPEMHNIPNLFASIWSKLDPKNYTKYIKDPRDKSYNTDPTIENIMLAMGRPVQGSDEDDHQEHLAVHGQLRTLPDYQIWVEPMKMNLQTHEQWHQQQVAQLSVARRGIVNPTQDASDASRGQRPL